MITTLEKFGLSAKQAKVYLASLELGPSPVQRIAKKAGVNRATTYVNLESLMKMGLISTYEKGKKTFFSAESPRNLAKLIKKDEELVILRKQEFDKYLPELEALHNRLEEKPTVRFFEGAEGIQAVREEINRISVPGEKVYVFTNLDELHQAFPTYDKDQYKKRVEIRKTPIKQIYNSVQGAIREREDKKALRESRFVPSNRFPFNASINIIPNKLVRFATYKGNFIGVIINSPTIANTLKAVFDLAWESADQFDKSARKNKKER